jgi:hypothetical protein
VSKSDDDTVTWVDNAPAIPAPGSPEQARTSLAVMTQDLQNIDRFALRQRVTLMVNRYEVRAGSREGPLLALAEQKRMSFREQVTFFADERKTQPLFAFRARQVMDLAATYDIMDASGQALGWFRKDFGRSLLRSAWVVDVPGQGISGSGTERNQVVALLRRFVENFNWPVHFDFTTAEGAVFLTIERAWSLRDAYECHLPPDSYGQRLDWRVGACLAVACDALLSR